MSYRSSIATLAVAILILATPTGPALAHSVEAGSLSITDLWTRVTPPRAPTAGGYMTIKNSGSGPDRLTAVASPAADRAEIHEMSTKGGTMTMRPVAGGFEIPAGDTVTLAPGGMHIMFIGLKEAFVDGGKVPVTLTFQQAGPVETFLHVLGFGATGPDGDHDHGAAEGGSGQ